LSEQAFKFLVFAKIPKHWLQKALKSKTNRIVSWQLLADGKKASAKEGASSEAL